MKRQTTNIALVRSRTPRVVLALLVSAVLGLGGLGCDDGAETSPNGEQGTNEPGTNVPGTNDDNLIGDGSGGSSEEALFGCSPEPTPVTDDEALPFGATVAELLAGVEGTHTGTLTYTDGTTTAFTLDVVRADGDAEWVDMEMMSDGSGIEPAFACEDYVRVPVELTLVTEDGTFDEVYAANLTASHPAALSADAMLDPNALSGTYAPDLDGDDITDTELAVAFHFDEDGLGGSVMLRVERVHGTGPDGTTSLSNDPVAELDGAAE